MPPLALRLRALLSQPRPLPSLLLRPILPQSRPFPPLLHRRCATSSSSVDPHCRNPNVLRQRPPDKNLFKVRLNGMFWSRPSSLALPVNSPLRIEDPKYEGLRHVVFKLLLFYSKQSKAIRGANVVYQRIISQIDEPAIYDVFQLEKTFKTTFSLLVLHTWLFLHRLKEDGKEGAEFGQYLYEIYNHDLELRVSKAGVNLLLTKWMKELEKIFYGNVVAYDAAMSPDAKIDELSNVIWRNIFSDDGTDMPNDAAMPALQAFSRYTRRESTCLSLTGKEAIFSGNFMFTSLEDHRPNSRKPAR